MRINLPVTNQEYILQDNEAPTSRTDIHGNIIYVNQDFIAVSGFSEAELLGQPQNIVRHPDMPEAAFADLWATIQSGKAWTGLVKNRCKNGDHYWVEANVAPVIENGTLVGYTSVRAKPSREQVSAAELAYQAIRSGNQNLEVSDGRVLDRTGFRRLFRMPALSLKALLTLAAGSMAVLFGAIGALAWLALAGADSARYLDGLLWVAGLGMPIAVVFGILAYRSVARPLLEIRRAIDQLSAGDLTGRLTPHGLRELADPLNALRILQVNLKWALGQIAESTDVVATGSQEIASGNAELSGRTESQASSLEETASAMEELTSTVQQNADNAAQASQLARSAAEVAGEGGKLVGQVVDTMAAISQSSHKISNIISVVDEIAFQTNLLSLNAAVEAARAGTQGRGFAVVATEVRNLAKRSADAAKEIKALIGDSVEKVDAGTELVGRAGKTMRDIVGAVSHVTDLVDEIATASQEQSTGIEQVSQAVGQLDEITQHNAALGEEAAAAAERLQAQSRTLATLAASFKLHASGAHRQIGIAARKPRAQVQSIKRAATRGGAVNQLTSQGRLRQASV